ncbi:MAG TPA: hypothetical protein VGN18_12755 [Jatrophihabitans sp.]|jgi:hypothetical protein|uniref:hypothetical protein n=1 Tax=Jatrophihabitans sp. TaxID=1932789 RepID=UPI002E02FB4A|nr:hypothetical protein [Jatrophihabitans sp.]
MTDYRTAPSTPPTQEWTQTQQYDREQPGMKDRANESLEQGKEAAGDLASTVGDKAGDVKDVTVKQARDLVDEARTQLGAHAGEQHRNLVTNLRSLSSELGDMTNSAATPGVATSLVSQARGQVDTVADWLDQREPDQLVGELRRFARRRPGAFLVGALAAGVVAGRLTRGAIDAHSGDSDSGGPSASGPAPRATVPPIAQQQPGMAVVDGLQTDPSAPFVPAPHEHNDYRAAAGQPFDPPPAFDPGAYQPSHDRTTNPVPGFTEVSAYPSETGETRELRHEEWQHGGGAPR